MLKAILFDADGVVLKKYKEYFVSQYFAREYNAPADEINAFFENDFRACQRGKLDLKEELVKHLPGWNWPNGVAAFLEYWFTSDAILDPEVMNEIEKIREKGFKCYLVSDQEKYRANYLAERLDLKNKFAKCFFSYELGYLKSQPEYFAEIFKITGLKPEEFAYFDDDQKNVDVAASLGINSRLYTKLDDIRNGGFLN
ncbi:MAG: HAD-IA family hydrolase [Candidatus Liptonbacteria bacterium]|nr:HAD-IA family hydrolase [Candidatus Liptonbacteria bacterium]